MSDEVTFSPDLYRGAAGYYDRFRLSYPDPLISDLVQRTGASGRGRLLDLACGTGQLAFALRSSFAEVWAVDQEPGMVEVVAAKAAASGPRASRRWSRARRSWTRRPRISRSPSSATPSTGFPGTSSRAGSTAGWSRAASSRSAGRRGPKWGRSTGRLPSAPC